MDGYKFIVTLLFTLAELRVANLESVEIKLGTRNVILPLDGPVHVKRLKLAELANLKLSIPHLVNLVEKVRGSPPPRHPVPPECVIPPDPIVPAPAEDTESSETTPNSNEDIIDSNSTFTLNINSATSQPALTFKQNRTTSQPKSSWNVDEINSKPTLIFNEDTEPPCPSTLLYDDAETLHSKESAETSHSITSKVDEVLSEETNDKDLIISVPALPSHKQETVVKDFEIYNDRPDIIIDTYVKATITNTVTTSPPEQYSTENAKEIFDHMPEDVPAIDLITSEITTSLPESDTSENVKEYYVHVVTDDTSMESQEKDPITDIPITSFLISNPTDITSVSFLPDYADNQEIFMEMKSREGDLTIYIPATSSEHDITTNFYHLSTNTPPPFTITELYDRDSMPDSPLTLPSRYDVTENFQAKHIESYDADSVSRETTNELATPDIPTLFSFEKGRTNNFQESYSHRRTGTLVLVTPNEPYLRVTSTESAPVYTSVSETETNTQDIQTPTLNTAGLHTRDVTVDFSGKASSESDDVTMDTFGISIAMEANLKAAESRVESPARAPNTSAPDRQTESSPQARERCTTADTPVLSPSIQTCTNKTESVTRRKKIRRPCKHARRGVRGRRRRRKRKPGAPGQERGRRRRRRRRRRRTTRAPSATAPRHESTTVSLTCGTEHCAHTDSTV